MRAEEFLNLYKELEDLLESRYSQSGRKYTSVIFEYLNDPDSLPVRDSLNICREVRNLLTHNAYLKNEPVAEPSVPVVEALRDVIDYVKKPPLALSFATSGENIIRAHRNQTVLKVMSIMEKLGFSHVPVIENGLVTDVFSANVLFDYVLASYSTPVNKNTTVGELLDALKDGRHSSNYVFADSQLTLLHAREIFQRVTAKNKRVSVIFITENGRKNEKLLRMLTPWDVMAEES